MIDKDRRFLSRLGLFHLFILRLLLDAPAPVRPLSNGPNETPKPENENPILRCLTMDETLSHVTLPSWQETGQSELASCGLLGPNRMCCGADRSRSYLSDPACRPYLPCLPIFSSFFGRSCLFEVGTV